MIPKSHNQLYISPQISISLNVNDINIILPYLLSHQIAFTVTGPQTETVMDTLPNLHTEQLNNILIVTDLCVAEDAYRKYIVEGVEKIPPKLEAIAAEAGISIAQFNKLFKERFGKPFYQVYMEHKMEYAASLLREGQTASTVSHRIGYAHPIKFNKMFQKVYGITPYKYQNKYQKAQA
ncbi:helix-turn-helix domain-containing protein [Runella aurantiaca]|uniref:AraC family transcriptional regulator n=1 Tax=Runella aurantiaca TaxID=2282308 RepID=A0A369IKZ7_9BACT|nr:AraC family transcriptional regulator [Runella aurantiaca]RDB08033.1 AraC family transcriptional regulator [Runella aurantiaca]